MRIRHPYQFVPFRDTLEREALSETAGHERYHSDLYSGRLRCTLEATSMLTIRTHFRDLKEAKQAPYIPGSSLKGMTRSMAQVLGAGCGLLFEDLTKEKKARRGGEVARPRRRITPDLGELKQCTIEEACLVCRVFGYAPPGAELGGGSEGVLAWAGKVRFHDSDCAEGWSSDGWCQSPEGSAQWQSQGAYHTAFYFPDERNPHKPAGWKVYFHAKRITPPDADFLPEACVPAGTVFPFDVEYENLSAEEFAVLRFALSLEHECIRYKVAGLHHKLGYGKPVGLGSCKISIEVMPLSARRYFGENWPELEESSCAVHKYLESPGFESMRKFLSWEDRPDEIQYPKYGWFLDNPRASIKAYEEEVNRELAVRDPENPVLAEQLAAPGAEQPTGPRFPKKLEVRITRVAGGKTWFETVETYEGRKYSGTAANNLYDAKAGDTCHLRVDKVDHRNLKVTGRISW